MIDVVAYPFLKFWDGKIDIFHRCGKRTELPNVANPVSLIENLLFLNVVVHTRVIDI